MENVVHRVSKMDTQNEKHGTSDPGPRAVHPYRQQESGAGSRCSFCMGLSVIHLDGYCHSSLINVILNVLSDSYFSRRMGVYSCYGVGDYISHVRRMTCFLICSASNGVGKPSSKTNRGVNIRV